VARAAGMAESVTGKLVLRTEATVTCSVARCLTRGLYTGVLREALLLLGKRYTMLQLRVETV
jgi:hypothetical protein